MRRAVITGIGVVSSIGNNKEEVLESLKQGRSGIAFNQEFADYNLRSNVSGKIDIDVKEFVDRKAMRFMGDAAAYAYISMAQAIEDAGLSEEQVSNERTGLLVGSGGGSSKWQVEAADILREKGVKRVGPYMVPRTMASTTSACLATPFKIKGVNYSISSACATSAHCIGHAVEQIQLGKQDVIFAGGGEELHWTLAMEFDAMGALSTKYNETPEKASRTYDANRDGFVISGGGGIVVVEELEHALARGAHIYAEITGYGATSDGYDMVAPSGEGAVRCMKQAMQGLEGGIDYLNTHGTSTPVGDVKELGAIQEVFGGNSPMISATKAMTGHALGAAGVHEAIFSLLMLEHNFVAPSINIDELDEQAQGLNIVTERKDVELNTVMSNSFGFGGTNATLVMSKYKG
ncbi:beta-ketoacyl-ACP synthase I [Pseudoalteromonas sp. SSMSWG5]|jgi:3-oxoacyl-[acyl-carrier-protein] synthase-1|uniref:beta-ketoacyl-ACP synthase I n=1 Tax=Pseudoalteromonas TaxID=53246 RepID=UPI000C5E3DE4|nr:MULTISPECIES: beta-ketoacyl-ACP synthase I [unclassified Pseudoalteromonas]MBD55506.1 beta-ketoacyl-[acyl-carrier-protein] synthase I [Pseudoalteromonas sp.]MCF2902187.1 beta-ketoacyl-ACP synthase I [Pseudoalteromonas sp. OFAV1]MCF2922285.1 beta-ketoacyl-ACP synthase I [Pseudoalteromonas sp. APAL1]MCO7248267.1 beta-ketoacyl-ACP synthase I [Pseudoalteromonas sp. Ps84H-4]TGV20153.1 beta-ketoacyl-ACP synthase I [Pseudoalteromonas sp. MEBiC 03607]|tara:strand:- start:5033 stop:6247 length:1215 start_codon:yes stop_codon:yes gene_type:complete